MADSFLQKTDLRELIGAEVSALEWYERALTHASLTRGQGQREGRECNERLEFLGDAVLGALVAEVLFTRFPEESEGYLTRLRARLVSGKMLARAARRMGLDRRLRMSEGMEQTGGRDNPAVLADVFEALLGAVYLDRGWEAARDFVNRHLLDPVGVDELSLQQGDYKSLLQEHAQARGEAPPQYRVVREEGPPHEKVFTVEVLLEGQVYGTGTAHSKKGAGQKAARRALVKIQGGGGRESDEEGANDRGAGGS